MFSLNLLISVSKIFVITVKRFEPATSSVRYQDATTVSVRQMCEIVRYDLYIFANSCFIDLFDSLNSLNLLNFLSI